MIKNSGRGEINNIIRMSGAKGITPYFESMLLRGQPRVYNKYGCIKIRFTKDLWRDVYYLLSMFWHFGAECTEIKKMKEEFEVADGRFISGAYEATIKKIGALMFEEDKVKKTIAGKEIEVNEDYAERINKLWVKRDEQ